MVSEPTSSTDTLIDLAYLSDLSMLTSCTIEPPLDGSDHCSLRLCLRLSPPRKKRVRRRVWLYRQADFESANNLLQSTPSSIIHDNDIDNFSVKWRDLFLTTMTSRIPSKNISSTRSLPNINSDLKCLIRKKQRCFRQAKNLNSERSWNKYNKARNKVMSALRSAKKAFFSNLSRDMKTPRDFWSTYNPLSPNHHRVPDNLTFQSETARSSLEKCDRLNRFFASCYSPSSPLPTQQTAAPASGPSLSDITCSEEDVFHLLSTFKAKTASGPDGISSAVLHGTACSISPALTAFFNRSLSQGVVPEDWKISPVPKSGDPSLANNYTDPSPCSPWCLKY